MADKSDPSNLLPHDLRRKWVAVPRYRMYWVVTFIFLLGAAFALGIVGLVLGIRWMTWSPPGVILTFTILNMFLRRREREDEEDIRRHAGG